jgi:hypothetical protein
MARKKSPESEAVAFFEAAPIDVAVAVLNIARGIVQRRQGVKPRRIVNTKSRPGLPLDDATERTA